MPNNDTTANVAIAEIRKIPMECIDRTVAAQLIGALASQIAYSPFARLPGADFKAMGQAVLHLDDAYLVLREPVEVTT